MWCPVGDFFCSADQLHPVQTWTRTVSTNDGLMVCRWVMPYQTGGTVGLTNAGNAPVTAPTRGPNRGLELGRAINAFP